MHKFNSIESFRHTVAKVRRWADFHKVPLPTVTFKGTVKLHGTNGGVHVSENGIIPQSRTSLLVNGNDNAGFAAFVNNPRVSEMFYELSKYINSIQHLLGESDEDKPFHYIFFGEWCGGNIQGKVALTELPKHFVIFQVFDTNTEKYIDSSWMSSLISVWRINKEMIERNPLYVDESMLKHLHSNNIHLIEEVDPWWLAIDFNKPEIYTEQLEKLTLQVEEECPWAKMFGASGVGEGIVWTPQSSVMYNPDWTFKVKGIQHQKSNKTKPTNLVHTDPVKVEQIRELVDQILPEWRLEQGVKEITPDEGMVTTKDTGAYINWIIKDVLKEEGDTIAANNFDWDKEISKVVIQKARQYFLTLVRT